MNENENKLKEKTISGFFWKICERLAAQAVSFVVTIVLARILMPEDYAPITLLTIFISVANIFISDGFCAALIQKKEVDELDYSSVLISSMVLAIFMYLVLWFFAPYVADFYEMPIICPTLRVLSLRIILAAINSVEIAYLTREMRFKVFFWGTFLGTAVSAVTGIVSAMNGLGTWSLVIQNLTNYTIDTLVLFIIIRKIPPLRFSLNRVKPLLKFGINILMNSLLFTVIEHIRTLIIGKKYSASDLSFYSKGQQFPLLVATCVSGPMTSVMFPAMATVNDDIRKVKYVFRQSIKVLTFVINPLLFGLAAVSDALIEVLLTEKWLFAAPYMVIFCIYYLFSPVHSLNQEAVKAIGRGDQVLKYGTIKRIISIVLIIVTVWFDPYIIAVGMIANAVLATIVNAYQNKKLFEYSYIEQLQDWIPNLVIGLVMFVIVYYTGKILTMNILFVLFIQVIEGIFVYLLFSKVTNNDSFQFIVNYIKEKRD